MRGWLGVTLLTNVAGTTSEYALKTPEDSLCEGPMAVLADSARSIIAAIEKVGAKSLITVNGSMVDDTGDRVLLRYLGKPRALRILKDVYTDMRGAEGEIHASHLEWGRVRGAGSVFCSRRRTVPRAR